MNNYFKYFGIALLVIALDQASKMWVHFQMDFGSPGQIQIFGDWFKLHYTTNPGMAFGMELGSEYGKMILTSFRLVAMVGIGYYLYYLIKQKTHVGYTFCISLILGGAPLWGGGYTALWPIFNVADASIFIGVAIILIFQNRFFPETKSEKVVPPQEPEEEQ